MSVPLRSQNSDGSYTLNPHRAVEYPKGHHVRSSCQVCGHTLTDSVHVKE